MATKKQSATRAKFTKAARQEQEHESWSRRHKARQAERSY